MGIALTAAVLTVAGCAHGKTGATAGPAAGAVSPSVSVASTPGSDPSTWTLPLLAYQPTPEQDGMIGKAELKLVRGCVSSFGVQWQPGPDLPPLGPKNLLDRRYGIHDLQLAERRGYQLDAAMQSRYDAAMKAQSAMPPPSADTEVLLGGTDIPPELLAQAGPEARSGMVAGKQIPPGGCFGQARRTLGSATHGVSQLVQQLTHQSYTESGQDPQVQAVFAQWSACMREKGFDYKAPMDANDDPRFEPSAKGVPKLEIATATADVTCRNIHKVAEIWHDSEARIQSREIEQNQDALTADRRSLDAVLNRAAAIVAQP
ncbi:hypothetical protein [Kitasatospora sp. NBC_01302]|uniref:hypothetical protein n=1 Tax=Kitasatospora sp. NBC_01302 TaxID=2903575 RepID=UPI002E15FCDE|nr:hypothetical protein OG294_19040 [Kitasatospora sp. NBC_01302]